MTLSATIFIDVDDVSLFEYIEKVAKKNFKNPVLVNGFSQSFIRWWHTNAAERHGDEQIFYCSQHKTPECGDVVFSLFSARVPTLTLNDCESLSCLHFSLSSLSSNGDGDERKREIEAVDFFLGVAQNKGKVVVIEGGDGAGKATQTRLLCEGLEKKNTVVRTLDFPYEKGLFGGLIRTILSGKKGGISELDPGLFSFLYSLNRYGCLPELSLWMKQGCAVVLDRYYTANFGHQASKLLEGQRKNFINQLEYLETVWLGLPKADLVVYLDLPPKVALEAMKHDQTRAYLDIHETAGNSYKENVRLTYVWCCKHLQGWKHVLCCNPEGERYSREDIQKTINGYVDGMMRESP